MGTGELPPADLGVAAQPSRIHGLDLCGSLRVPELADVEVASSGRRSPDDRLPPEHDVATRPASSAAPPRHAARVGRTCSRPRNGSSTDGCASLNWRNRGSDVVATEEKEDPGTRPHAADADHLACGMHVAVAFEQRSPVVRERTAVGADHVPDRVLEMLLLGTRQNILDGGDERRVDQRVRNSPSTEVQSFARARRLSFVRAVAICALEPLQLLRETLELNRAMMSPRRDGCTRRRAFRIVAKFAIASRYSRTVSVTMARRAALAVAELAARRPRSSRRAA